MKENILWAIILISLALDSLIVNIIKIIINSKKDKIDKSYSYN
jgi:hypothetical protein